MKNKKAWIRAFEKVSNLRDYSIAFGTMLFGGLGFVYSSVLLSFYYVERDMEVPRLITFATELFGHWISITIILGFISVVLSAIIHNKKNWK